MKFNYKTIFLSLAMLVVSFATYAQLPDSGDQSDTSDTESDPDASISTKLIWLAIVGIAFAYYQLNARRKRA